MTKLDKSSDDLDQHIEYLDVLVNEDILEEFQDINPEGSFSGKNLREMTIAIKMHDKYKFLVAPASGDLHGEWSTLDRYSLQRCRNRLHRGHRVAAGNSLYLIDPQSILICGRRTG